MLELSTVRRTCFLASPMRLGRRGPSRTTGGATILVVGDFGLIGPAIDILLSPHRLPVGTDRPGAFDVMDHFVQRRPLVGGAQRGKFGNHSHRFLLGSRAIIRTLSKKARLSRGSWLTGGSPIGRHRHRRFIASCGPEIGVSVYIASPHCRFLHRSKAAIPSPQGLLSGSGGSEACQRDGLRTPHAERAGRGGREVDDPTACERTAVIDPDHHGPSGASARYEHPRAEGEETMCCRKGPGIQAFAAGRAVTPEAWSIPGREAAGPETTKAVGFGHSGCQRR